MGQAEIAVVPESLRALIGLFETELSEVQFPDMNLRVLTEAAKQVLTASEQVAEAEKALEAAQAELQEQQEALLLKGQRALAYARIYAEESPELIEKLQLITLPRSQRRARSEVPPTTGADVVPVRRRGRPPKQKAEVPNLFAEEAQVVELGQTG